MSPDATSTSSSSSPAPGNGPQPPSISDRIIAFLLTALVLAAIVLSMIVVLEKGTAMDRLKVATGYALLIFVFFLSMTVLLDIIRNKINLSEVIEELSGGASLSRFQLLIFTFVFAFSFLIVVACKCEFPAIPGNVLALLGVSASTYAISKGLQVSSGDVGTTPSPATNGKANKPN